MMYSPGDSDSSPFLYAKTYTPKTLQRRLRKEKRKKKKNKERKGASNNYYRIGNSQKVGASSTDGEEDKG